MYKRLFSPEKNQSFFLFGPRATGKTTWLKQEYPYALYIDFLEARNFRTFLNNPQYLEKIIPPNFKHEIILDEVQRIPELLNEVHRLIEQYNYIFILSGSNARKLKKNNANLLAGRAFSYKMYPLTVHELQNDFSIKKSIQYGHLPKVYKSKNPEKYLESYITTYLEQEIQAEGLSRSIENFSRFLEIASFSQGSVLNMSEISRECEISRTSVENYFSIIKDLLIAKTIPVFTKKAKRRMIKHEKFYFFDTGVYQTLRPKGIYDSPELIGGVAIESLVLQEIIAINDYFKKQYNIYYWRTSHGTEVDFILYGPQGFIAIEVKSNLKIHKKHLKGIQSFQKDYPEVKAYLLYSGEDVLYENNITIIPTKLFLKNLVTYL